MTYPDWSEVEWFVYGLEIPAVRHPVCRVSPRELKPGELKPGERFVSAVVGVSRATVLMLLRRGVHPAALQREVGRLAEAQHARSADDRRPNAYLAQLAKQEHEAEQLTFQKAA